MVRQLKFGSPTQNSPNCSPSDLYLFGNTKNSFIDGAPCHKAAQTLAYFQTWLPDNQFITQRTGKYINDKQFFWAPSSPDLNPLDYAVWSALKKFLFDIGARTYDDVIAGVGRFFDENQELIKNSILGAIKK